MLNKSLAPLLLAVIGLAGCSGDAESPDFVPQLTSVHVSPKAATLAPGTKGVFTATGCFTTPPSRGDALTCHDVTDQISWESLESNVASLDGPVAFAKSAGDTMIIAGLDGIEDTAELLVNGAELKILEISPNSSQVPLGLTQQFTATGIFFENGQEVGEQDLSDQVDWSSVQPHIAPIAAGGLAEGDSIGLTDISATFVNAVGNTFTATAELEVVDAVLQKVALNLEPEREELPEGSRKTFRSYGLFSDDTCRNVSYEISQDSDPAVGFFSSDESIARMDPYNADVQGVFAYGVPQDPDLIEPRPAEGNPPGITRPVVAMSHCSTLFEKTSPPKQTGGDDTGNQPENLGDVIITATYRARDGSLLVDTASIYRSPAEIASIRVTPENGVDPAEVVPGFELQFVAFAVYTDGTEIEITDSPDTLWTTDDDAISIVQNQNDAGLAEGVSGGLASVQATFSGITGESDLTVLNATLDAIALGPDLFCVGATRVPETVAEGNFDPSNFPPEANSDGQVVPGGQEVVANGLLSNGTIFDVSEDVTWTAQYGVWSDEDQRCADPVMPTSSPAAVSNAAGSSGDVSSAAQLLLGTSCITAYHAGTDTLGGGTAIVLPILEDDISEIELCDAIMPLLTLGDAVTPADAGIPIELVGLVGQVLQPVLTNLQAGDTDVQDVVHEVVGLVGQLTDPVTPVTTPLLGNLRDLVLSPALNGAHDLLCSIIPDDSCD